MSSAILIECLLICCSYVYNLGDAFQNCLIFYWGDAFGPGYSGLITFGYCCAKNQALRILIACFAKLFRLEIGIDGFGVKKHVAS